MTTPAPPDTGAGAEPDTGSAPTTEAEQQPTESATDDFDWKAEAEKYKALARKHEDRAKANKRALDEAAATRAGEPSIEDLQRQLAERDELVSEYKDFRAKVSYEKAVNAVAKTAALDADALLDSGSFADAVDEELSDDFDEAELKAAVAKVAKQQQFAKSPRFVKTAAPARSGADITGGPGTPRQITEDELHKMTPEQIVEAQDKGLLKNLLGG